MIAICSASIHGIPARTISISSNRQMVLFAVERRKAWRMLQSKGGVVNKDSALHQC